MRISTESRNASCDISSFNLTFFIKTSLTAKSKHTQRDYSKRYNRLRHLRFGWGSETRTALPLDIDPQEGMTELEIIYSNNKGKSLDSKMPSLL